MRGGLVPAGFVWCVGWLVSLLLSLSLEAACAAVEGPLAPAVVRVWRGRPTNWPLAASAHFSLLLVSGRSMLPTDLTLEVSVGL